MWPYFGNPSDHLLILLIFICFIPFLVWVCAVNGYNVSILQIKPQQYMEMISSMKPNLWATLADEVPASVTEKRNKVSVDRTVKWLEDCIKLSFAKEVCMSISKLDCDTFLHLKLNIGMWLLPCIRNPLIIVCFLGLDTKSFLV